MFGLVTHRRDAIMNVMNQVITLAQRDLDLYQEQLPIEQERGDKDAILYCEGMIIGIQFVIDILRAALRLL